MLVSLWLRLCLLSQYLIIIHFPICVRYNYHNPDISESCFVS